jgi:hypothetical protein
MNSKKIGFGKINKYWAQWSYLNYRKKNNINWWYLVSRVSWGTCCFRPSSGLKAIETRNCISTLVIIYKLQDVISHKTVFLISLPWEPNISRSLSVVTLPTQVTGVRCQEFNRLWLSWILNQYFWYSNAGNSWNFTNVTERKSFIIQKDVLNKKRFIW